MDDYCYNEDRLADFIAINNELRDRPLRQLTDRMIRRFFESFDNDCSKMTEYLSPDAKLITGLKSPGDIYNDPEAIIGWFKRSRCKNQKTSLQLLLVDRGRVTCYATHFRTAFSVTHKFWETRQVYIMDLNDRNQIQRIELRGHENESVMRDGGRDAMLQACIESELNAMKMKEFF
ncbi:hypothetical protein LY78DRAFT_721508 [Colletotrichum sublineola]|nr:hypothetical protein LY78DRAFT_721508 [Colletotrichum sublineola]